MEITKENLEKLRNEPLMKLVTSMFQWDLDEMINYAKKELEKKEDSKIEDSEIKEKTSSLASKIKDTLDKMEADGKLKSYTNGIEKYYYTPDEKVSSNTEEHGTEQATPEFVMSKEQFVKFCRDYRDLVAAKNRLNYIFGIDVGDEGSGFSFSGKVQEIIWDLIEIIFGEDNRDDIADFIYGNSNFDTAGDLYEELC